MTDKGNDRLLTQQEAAAMLGVSTRTLRRMQPRLHRAVVYLPSPSGGKDLLRFSQAELRTYIALLRAAA